MESDLQLKERPVTTAATIASRISSFRWTIIALAFVITLVNYLDRSAISYAIDPIKREFGLNNADFGYIASAFGIGYMIMTVGGGILVDRWGAHKIWSGAAVLWSTCTAAMGLAAGFWPLFLLRTTLGIAEGPHFPALTRVVADWLPASERARATSYGLAAVPFASVIGAPLLSNLIVQLGWKMTFIMLGGLGIAWSVAWLYFFRDYPENCARVSDSELMHIREGQIVDRTMSADRIRTHSHSIGGTTWRFMLLNPSLLANNLAFFSFGYMLFFAMTWLPGYFEQTYGLHLKEVGYISIAPWLTAALLIPFAGWLSDYLWLKTGSKRIARSHMIWICQLASALCLIPVVFTHDLTVAVVMISLAMGLGLMPNAAFYALNCDLAKDKAATSIGIMDCFFAASGIAAPALTGKLSEMTGGFAAAFGLLIGFTVLSVVAILVLQRPDRAVEQTS